MTTQNRYYSNLSQASFVTNVGGVSSSDSALTVQTTAGWPSTAPFTIRFEPGTANEEVALVASGSGTSGAPFQLSHRGYDGTAPLAHALGAAVVPGFCQLDFAEPQQHINQSSALALVNGNTAHNLPASTWTGGTVSLISKIAAPASNIISIPSIPQTFQHLRLEYSLVGNGTGTGGLPSVAYADYMTMRFNGSTTPTYQSISSYVAGTASSTGLLRLGGSTGSTLGMLVAPIWTHAVSTNGRGRGVIDIPDYTGTGDIKTMTCQGTASDGGADLVTLTGGGAAGSPANPVSSIQLQIYNSSTAFSAGTVWLYGIN